MRAHISRRPRGGNRTCKALSRITIDRRASMATSRPEEDGHERSSMRPEEWFSLAFNLER
jgi:hypothetical protein